MDLRRSLQSARATVLFGGIPVGKVQGFRVTEDFSQFPIEGLGDLFVESHEILSIRVSGTFDILRILEAPFNRTGSGIWYSQQATQRSIILQGASTISLRDDITGADILAVEAMKPTSRTFSINQGQVLMENGSFVARKLKERQTPLYTPAT